MRTLMMLTSGIMVCSMATAQTAKQVEANPAVAASNAFACDLFKKLEEANRAKNLFFSPFSISSALAMTLDGARGETALEMGNVLRLPESLRGNAVNEPWRTGPYALGFND